MIQEVLSHDISYLPLYKKSLSLTPMLFLQKKVHGSFSGAFDLKPIAAYARQNNRHNKPKKNLALVHNIPFSLYREKGKYLSVALVGGLPLIKYNIL